MSIQALPFITIMALVTYKLHDAHTPEKFKSPNFWHVISLCKYFYKMRKVESKCTLTSIRQKYYNNSCTPITLISSVEELHYFDKPVQGTELFLNLASTANPYKVSLTLRRTSKNLSQIKGSSGIICGNIQRVEYKKLNKMQNPS
jgi:hypothetical protein